jgi:hypothetical protein
VSESSPRPRVVVIAHHDAPLHTETLSRWVETWGKLVGIVVLHESRASFWKRVKRERKRIGFARLLDVLAFRVYYRLTHASRDAAWKRRLQARLAETLPSLLPTVPRCETTSPNSREAQEFIAQQSPDLMLALCKQIIAERVFSIPRAGTFVLHPGICPEYRNAHGCFWALANDDLERVGLTLLRIDRGIDTGPIFGYYTASFDERNDSHIVIQHRVLFENLTPIATRLVEIWRGNATPLSTAGRASEAYGQPWLTAWWKWKRAAARRANAAVAPPARPLP